MKAFTNEELMSLNKQIEECEGDVTKKLAILMQYCRREAECEIFCEIPVVDKHCYMQGGGTDGKPRPADGAKPLTADRDRKEGGKDESPHGNAGKDDRFRQLRGKQQENKEIQSGTADTAHHGAKKRDFRHIPDFHPLAGDVKDVAAGAVLICAIVAAIIGLIVFIPYLFS